MPVSKEEIRRVASEYVRHQDDLRQFIGLKPYSTERREELVSIECWVIEAMERKQDEILSVLKETQCL